MGEQTWLTIIAIVPFLTFLGMFWLLMYYNKTTTGEIKNILPPEVLLKIMTVILVVIVVFILTYLKMMEISVTAAILGSVVTGTFNFVTKTKDKDH